MKIKGFNIYYKVLDWDNDCYDYFDTLKDAKNGVREMYKNGSKNLRIYMVADDGEESDDLGGIFFYGQDGIENEENTLEEELALLTEQETIDYANNNL